IFALILWAGDISPNHCDLLRIIDNPNESQTTDITQLVFGQTLSAMPEMPATGAVFLANADQGLLGGLHGSLAFALQYSIIPNPITFANNFKMATGVDMPMELANYVGSLNIQGLHLLNGAIQRL
ncbi:MAG: hypothetical protein JKX91_08625, partial [Rhizobiaceae bacterium]|nr:hypothetical protein [Rhizobiaceae bacterium]